MSGTNGVSSCLTNFLIRGASAQYFNANRNGLAASRLRSSVHFAEVIAFVLGAVAYGPAIRDRTPPLTLDHPPGSLACQVSRCRDSSFAKKSGPEMCDARIYFSVPDFSADVFIASALNSAGGITG